MEEKKVLLTEEEFCNVIKRLQYADDFITDVNHVIHNYRDRLGTDVFDGNGFSVNFDYLVIELLEKIMHDTTDLIGYFVYDCDYGRDFKLGMIKEADGTEVDISTSQKLYQYLINNME